MTIEEFRTALIQSLGHTVSVDVAVQVYAESVEGLLRERVAMVAHFDEEVEARYGYMQAEIAAIKDGHARESKWARGRISDLAAAALGLIVERDEARAEIATLKAAHEAKVTELDGVISQHRQKFYDVVTRITDRGEALREMLVSAEKERDEARAEVEKLKEDLKLVAENAQEYETWCKGNQDRAVQGELDIGAENGRLQEEVERLKAIRMDEAEHNASTFNAMEEKCIAAEAEVERLKGERDEACEETREATKSISDVLTRLKNSEMQVVALKRQCDREREAQELSGHGEDAALARMGKAVERLALADKLAEAVKGYTAPTGYCDGRYMLPMVEATDAYLSSREGVGEQPPNRNIHSTRCPSHGGLACNCTGYVPEAPAQPSDHAIYDKLDGKCRRRDEHVCDLPPAQPSEDPGEPSKLYCIECDYPKEAGDHEVGCYEGSRVEGARFKADPLAQPSEDSGAPPAKAPLLEASHRQDPITLACVACSMEAGNFVRWPCVASAPPPPDHARVLAEALRWALLLLKMHALTTRVLVNGTETAAEYLQAEAALADYDREGGEGETYDRSCPGCTSLGRKCVACISREGAKRPELPLCRVGCGTPALEYCGLHAGHLVQELRNEIAQLTAREKKS